MNFATRAETVKFLTQETLRSLFDYNTETGVLTRRVRYGIGEKGSVVGWLGKNGYIQVQLFGFRFLAHHLVWVWVHGGPFPRGIDHKNRNKQDNRVDNLRLANQSQNCANKPKDKSPTTSKYKGVHRWGGVKWRACIRYGGGGTRHLGLFDSEEEAARAYAKKAREVFGEFADPELIDG
jgi:hypothetical protein